MRWSSTAFQTMIAQTIHNTRAMRTADAGCLSTATQRRALAISIRSNYRIPLPGAPTSWRAAPKRDTFRRPSLRRIRVRARPHNSIARGRDFTQHCDGAGVSASAHWTPAHDCTHDAELGHCHCTETGSVTLMSADVRNCHRPILIAALARAMAARDESVHEHAERVQRYALALAREIRITDDRMLDAIDTAALLHDVGKLGIPDRLLNKPGPLTPEEYTAVKQHAAIGAELLSAVPFNGPLALIVRHHHENWD